MKSTDEETSHERPAFDWVDDRLRLQTRVIPRSSRACLGRTINGRLQVYLHAPPADGQANQELIQLLAKAFGVARSAVTIANGARTRNKTVHITTPRNLPPNLQ